MKTIKTLMPIPAKYKWMTVDEDGIVCIWQYKPKPSEILWISKNGEICTSLFKITKPNDWTKAIWRIEEYEEIL